MPEIIDRNLVSDGELKDAEDVAAARAHGGCPDETASVGIRDDHDQPVIAGTVDPAAGGDSCFLDAGSHVNPVLARLFLRLPRGADLGIGERYARLRPVVRAGPRIPQDI